MRIVDISKPRRSEKMRKFLSEEEYVAVGKDDDWPVGDYLLCPGAWWYKGKLKSYADRANNHQGRTVLLDFSRMFEKPRRNQTGIQADFVVSAFDTVAVPVSHFPCSLPSLDPSVVRVPGEDVVVTSRDDRGDVVTSLIRHLKGKKIHWKLRNKYGHLADHIRSELIGADAEFYYMLEKDYNEAEPLLDRLGAMAGMHINLSRVSWTNYEMARAGVPTYVWDGKLRKKRKVQQFAKMYEGVEQYHCTKNLIRHLRDNL